MTFNQLQNQISQELQTLEPNYALSIKFLNSQETFAVNENTQFWAASVIKLPIACQVYKDVLEGKLSLNKKLKVEGENRVRGTGAIKLLDPNDEFTIQDLINLILAVSDNTAANVLIDLLGWESIEPYTHELGLVNSTFKHKLMIKAGRGPNLTTANDMTLLLEMLYANKLPFSSTILELMEEEQNRNGIPLFLPNEIAVSHKTGTLPEAFHNVGIVHSKNPFIVSFFSDDQKDKVKTRMALAECSKLCYEYSI